MPPNKRGEEDEATHFAHLLLGDAIGAHFFLYKHRCLTWCISLTFQPVTGDISSGEGLMRDDEGHYHYSLCINIAIVACVKEAVAFNWHVVIN